MSENPIIEINVGELASKFYTGGDLIFSSSGIDAAREGNRLHKLWQESRSEVYLAEVPVENIFAFDEYSIKIRGRMDGLYPDRDIITIEELKSTSRDPQNCIQQPSPSHLAQLMIYAYLYAVSNEFNDQQSISLNLVYLNINSSDFAFYTEVVTQKILRNHFEELLDKYMQWYFQVEDWKKLRNVSAQSMTFPFNEYRKGQRNLAVNTYQAIRYEKRLIAAAPTGIGKTISTLFPSIKAMGEGLLERIFYLTARNTVQTIGEQNLKLMISKGLLIRSVTIVARERVCLDMDGACRMNLCTRCEGYFDRLPQAMQDVMQETVLDQIKIRTIADKHSLCPFELSLDASLVADVIFCDYNYAFHPRATLRRHFVDNISKHVLLIDEGHHLMERARDMFSAELHTLNLRNISRKTRNKDAELTAAIVAVSQWIERQARLNLRHTQHESSSSLQAPEELAPLLKNLQEHLSRIFEDLNQPQMQADIRQLSFDIIWFQQILQDFDEDYLCLLEQNPENTMIQLFCMDPSSRIERSISRSQTAVLFSATLHPLNYFREIMGWPEHSYLLHLESPFPVENLNFLIDGSISMRYQDRSKSQPKVIQRIVSFIRNCPGNIMIFSPSHEYQKSLVYDVQKHCPNREYLIQEQNMNQSQRQDFLDKFQVSEKTGNTVGFAVLGGLFSEGIDLVGNQLQGAIILGIGAPPPNVRQRELQEYFQRQYQQGFEFGFRLPGFQRVLQAVGRVIRSHEDKGSVLLIDQRYCSSAYKKLFPIHWQTIYVNSNAKLESELQKFWN